MSNQKLLKAKGSLPLQISSLGLTFYDLRTKISNPILISLPHFEQKVGKNSRVTFGKICVFYLGLTDSGNSGK